MEIMIYSDVLRKPGCTTELRQASDFLLELPLRITKINGSKGMPLVYALIPLNLLTYTLNVEVKPDIIFRQPSTNRLEGLPSFFNELRDFQQKLTDSLSRDYTIQLLRA